jgi:hypothetical protein
MVIIAVAGLVTTGAAPALQSAAKARYDTRAWRRGERTAAYEGAMTHAQLLSARTDFAIEQEEYVGTRDALDKPHPELVAARLRLWASAEVWSAWSEMRDAEDGLAWAFHQGDYGPGSPPQRSDPEVVRVRAATEQFFAMVRRDAAR